MALIKKRISAFDAGKGISQIVRSSTTLEIFNLFGVKGVKLEGGSATQDTIHENSEILCGILWAVWFGIQKRGLRFPIPNLIIDGMLSMIQLPDLYVEMLNKLPRRITEYNETLQQHLPDFPRASLFVSDKFCRNVGKRRKMQDIGQKVGFLKSRLPSEMLSNLTKTKLKLFRFIRNRWCFKRVIEPAPEIPMRKQIHSQQSGTNSKGTS